MRVVFLNPVGILGGAERCLLDIFESLIRHRPDIQPVLLTLGDGPLVARSRSLGVITHVLPMPSTMARLGDSHLKHQSRREKLRFAALVGLPETLRHSSYLRKFGSTLSETRPTLIHSNGIKTHLLAALASPATVPLVWHVRDYLASRPLASRILRAVSKRVRSVVTISNSGARDVIRTLGKVPVEVVYDAVDVDHFRPGKGDGAWLDRVCGVPRSIEPVLRVGIVATYARWKGHDVFLEAAARLRQLGHRQVRFYIIGGPVYDTAGSQLTRADLSYQVDALALAECVGFSGFLSEVDSVYRALDIVVHASTEPEPFGRTIVEAMACACPVIVANAGGAAELFEHGVDALGVHPADPRALATAISKLVSDREGRARMGRLARRTAIERFSTARLGPRLGSLYDSLLEESR